MLVNLLMHLAFKDKCPFPAKPDWFSYKVRNYYPEFSKPGKETAGMRYKPQLVWS